MIKPSVLRAACGGEAERACVIVSSIEAEDVAILVVSVESGPSISITVRRRIVRKTSGGRIVTSEVLSPGSVVAVRERASAFVIVTPGLWKRTKWNSLIQ